MEQEKNFFIAKCGFELHGFFLEPKTAYLKARTATVAVLAQGLTAVEYRPEIF